MRNPELESWRRSWQAEMPAGGAACPPDETLAALALGEVGGAERAALADHVASCRGCAESFRTLVELDREASRLGWRHRRGMVRGTLAAAAAIVVALTGVLWFAMEFQARRTADETLRAAPAGALRPAAHGVLDRPPERFAWPPQGGATGYRVRLYDESAGLVWESPETPEAAVRLPAPPPPLADGAYFWTVEVEGPAARSRLGPYWFRIGG